MCQYESEKKKTNHRIKSTSMAKSNPQNKHKNAIDYSSLMEKPTMNNANNNLLKSVCQKPGNIELQRNIHHIF